MTKKKIFIKCAVFFLIFVILFYAAQEILTNKWDVYAEKYRAYTEEPAGSLDILFIGSSTAWAGINPMIMWEENGITSFNLSTNFNTPFLNLQDLLLGLETQSPKIVAMDFNCLCKERKASWPDYDYVFRYVHDSLPFRRQQLAFERALYEVDPDVDILSYYIPFLYYHTRWDELVKTDFIGRHENYHRYIKGALFNLNTLEEEDPFCPPYEGLNENVIPSPVSEYSWTFYNEIIDLCREKDISLIILRFPQSLTPEDVELLGLYMTLEEICKSYQLDYYDLNKLDFWESNHLCADDFYDRGHLNWRGSIKFSASLADILQRDFDLPDHRGDPAYSAWEKDWDDFYQDYSSQLSEFGYRAN